MKLRIILSLLLLVVALSVSSQNIEGNTEKNITKILNFQKLQPVISNANTSRAAVSDTTIPAPVIDFTGNKVFTKFETSIENSTDSTIIFTFSDYPVTDSQFIADYVLSWVTNPLDTEQSKLQVANRSAYFLKSPKHYRNNALIFGGQWNDSMLFAKEHSLIGRIFSTDLSQCGNNSEHYRLMCLASGFFKPDDFRSVSVTIHAFEETKFGGHWALTDGDVGTCIFTVNNPDSPNGLASFMDVHNDTLLINQKYLEDGLDYHPDMSLSFYREVMSDTNINVAPFPWSSHVEINGKFILPAHSKMSLSLEDYIFFIDTGISKNKIWLYQLSTIVDSFEVAMSVGDTCWWCVDSFMFLLDNFCDGDTFLSAKFFDKGNTFLYDGSNDQGKKWSDLFRYDGKREWIPTIVLETHSPDTLTLGHDLKMPLFVLESDGGLLAGDTLITQPAVFPLWNTGDTSNILTFREINYLEQGWISSGDHVTKLSWNANILGNFADWNISGGNGLTLGRTLTEYHRDTIGGLLPVELSKLAANPVDNQYIKISWETSLEIDNDRFEVLRSTNGNSFEVLGTVMGNGTTTTTHYYVFDDWTALPSITYYYRLRQIDTDGTATLSSVVSAKLTSSDNKVIAVEYINLLGQRVAKDVKGIKILRSLHESGFITTRFMRDL